MRLERHLVFWVVVGLVLSGLLWLLSPILLPFVVGAVLAYLLDPLATALTRRGLSRLLAALVILVGFIAVFAVLVAFAAPILLNQLSALINNIPGYVQRLQSLVNNPAHPWLNAIVGSAFGGSNWSVGALLNRSVDYLTRIFSSLWSKGEALLSLFSLLVITPVVAFYLLCDWSRMVKAFDQLIPLPQRETVHDLFRQINAAISAYLHGQLIVCVILGGYYAIGLTLAGLSFGVLIGFVSGLLTFIPYFGSFIALIVSFVAALAQFFPDWMRILAVVGVVLVGQFLEGNVLAPKLVGKSVGLHPVWLIFALLAFGYLFGFVGLLLAVPLAAAAGVLMRFAVQRYRASTLYTGNEPT